MVEPANDRCLCGCHVATGTCVVALLHIVALIISSLAYFAVINGDPHVLRLSPELRAALISRFDAPPSEFYLIWAMLALQFIAALCVIFGQIMRQGKWLWPFLILSTAILVQDIWVQIAVVVKTQTFRPTTIVNFAFILIGCYLTSVVYRGKLYIDWRRRQRKKRAPSVDSGVSGGVGGGSVYDYDQPANASYSRRPDSTRRPTAPPENMYYEFR